MRIALFMTRGLSLKAWDEGGVLAREVALYRGLANQGIFVTIVSYGGREDLAFRECVPGLRVRCNSLGLPAAHYVRLMPLVHGLSLAGHALIKSNQIDGAQAAARMARLLRKPLVVRCGYLKSDYLAWERGASAPATLAAEREEDALAAAAGRVVVTTTAMAELVIARQPAIADRVTVVPNYVDTDLFTPDGAVGPTCDLLFVGRLAEQKNIDALLAAAANTGARLTMVGDGPLRTQVAAAAATNPNLTWHKKVANTALPPLMRGARLFVQPSHWEGHPKTLIEAMAAGRPVLGTDAPGIRNVISSGIDGWLSGTDSESLTNAIRHLLGDPSLLRRLGEAAHRVAVERYALDSVLAREIAVLTSVAAGEKHR